MGLVLPPLTLYSHHLSSSPDTTLLTALAPRLAGIINSILATESNSHGTHRITLQTLQDQLLECTESAIDTDTHMHTTTDDKQEIQRSEVRDDDDDPSDNDDDSTKHDFQSHYNTTHEHSYN